MYSCVGENGAHGRLNGGSATGGNIQRGAFFVPDVKEMRSQSS